MKIGFCCKWLDSQRSKNIKDLLISEGPMNQRSTTLTHLRSLGNQQAYDKMLEIVDHNIQALRRQLKWIAEQPPCMRLFRITSDFVPAYTVDEFNWITRDPAFDHTLKLGLAHVKDYADLHGIRLCSHPGQYSNLCSTTPDVVSRAIEDLEYHALIARYMGYGHTWHSSGFAINVHANHNQDPNLTQFKDVVANRVSETVANLITLENDEFGCSVDEIVASDIGQSVALVLDIHHHFIQSSGQYIQVQDPRTRIFESSWRGQRALAHVSVSSEQLLVNHCAHTLPNFAALGFSKSKLRAHSDLMWNQAVLAWAADHLTWTDLEIEAKGKNLASAQFYNWLVANNKVSNSDTGTGVL